MSDYNTIRPFLSENARGEEAGKLETATRAQKSNQYYVIEVSNNELMDYTEFSNYDEAMDEIKQLWDSFWFDCSECSDWECERFENGFTNGYANFLVITEEEFNKEWRDQVCR
jgi:hypothetical protein